MKLIFKLSQIIVMGTLALACGEKKTEEPVEEAPEAKAVKASEEAAPVGEEAKEPETGKDPSLEEKCAVFVPPWKDGSWVEWGQANPEAGEEWYDTIEETMKKADLSVLPKCTNLEYMFVGFSELPDLEPLSKLTNLKRLDLRMMPQIKDLSPLSNLKGLEYLNITGTGVEDLSPLASLDGLVELEARMLTVKDLSPLARLPRLVSLDVLKCPVTDVTALAESPSLEKALLCTTDVGDIKPLKKIAPRLTALDLCDSQFRDFEDLRDFPRLDFLRLWGLPIEDLTVLEKMTEMEDLDLSKTPVKDLTPLHGMKKLKILRLLMVEIDPRQIEDLKKAIPGLEVIQKLTPS